MQKAHAAIDARSAKIKLTIRIHKFVWTSFSQSIFPVRSTHLSLAVFLRVCMNSIWLAAHTFIQCYYYCYYCYWCYYYLSFYFNFYLPRLQFRPHLRISPLSVNPGLKFSPIWHERWISDLWMWLRWLKPNGRRRRRHTNGRTVNFK